MTDYLFDESGSYAGILGNPNVKTLPDGVVPVYDSKYNIDKNTLTISDDNVTTIDSVLPGGSTNKLYPIRIPGARAEYNDVLNATFYPVTMMTPYKNDKTGETGYGVLKTYYYFAQVNVSSVSSRRVATYRVLKGCYGILTDSLEVAKWFVDNTSTIYCKAEGGSFADGLDVAFDSGVVINYKTWGGIATSSGNELERRIIQSNEGSWLSHQYNLFSNEVQLSTGYEASVAFDSMKARNENTLNLQPFIGTAGSREFIANAFTYFNPSGYIGATDWTIGEGGHMSNLIKKVIRTGVDYLHNIDIYDETLRKNRNMMLENRVGTLPYELVNYSTPEGTIRVKSGTHFTHFIGAGFENNNMPRIYRVKACRTVGSGVMEYDFSIDYYKDYFQHYTNDTLSGMLCKATTDKDYYCKELITGGEPVQGASKYHIATINYDRRDYQYFILSGKISGHAVASYIISESQLIALYNMLLTSEQASKMVQAISRIEYLPAVSTAYIRSLSDENADLEDVPTLVAKRITTLASSFTAEIEIASGKLGSLDDLYTNGLEYNATTKVTIPGYGQFELNKAVKKSLQRAKESGTNITIKLRYQIVTGDCNLVIEANGENFYDFPIQKLGEMPIMSSDKVQQIRTYGQSSLIQATGNLYTSAFSGAIGGLGGAGVAMGGVQYLSNLGTAGYNIYNMLNTIGPNIQQGTGGTVIDEILFETYWPDVRNIERYYQATGYPCAEYTETMSFKSGNKYTVDVLDASYGTDEYAQRTRDAIQENYMIYNYNTAAGV